MKKLLIFMGIFLLADQPGSAQSSKKTKKPAVKKSVAAAKSQTANRNGNTIQLRSESTGQAKVVTTSTPLKISDPIITTLNMRANGSNIPISSSGIVGVSKRTYGFANGRILLRSTASTTSGTSTGTPSVGTGSSLSTIGSTGPFIGMNGKSPYAGSAMWGNARGLVHPYSAKNN